MSFSRNNIQQVTKTLSDGTVIGTESVDVSIAYKVKEVHVTENQTEAYLYYSYDDGLSWQVFGKYLVSIDMSINVSILQQAEDQIQALEYFKS